MKKLLIDGDMILYRAAFAAEKETRWDDDIFTVHSDFSDLKDAFTVFIDGLEEILDSDDVSLAFSDRVTFRHQMNPLYKAHRKQKRTPLGLGALREWACEEWPIIFWENLEADDMLGILGSRDRDGSIVVSGDKDFATVPCTWYNFIRDEMRVISEDEANYAHFSQTLAGDATDGYFGVPRVGIKTAEKILDKQGVTWEAVIEAYEKAGMSETEALLNARMAYILRDGDYNPETTEVKLWTPN